NKDGSDDNRSWNCGVEGPTDDRAIRDLRNRQKRNMLATLLFSQGTPMILGGDEFGRTQQGNNNAYCQDNDITWFDWDLDEDGKDQTVLMIMNSFEGGVAFRLPQATGGSQWSLLVDTNIPDAPPGANFAFGSTYEVTGRSLLLFSLLP